MMESANMLKKVGVQLTTLALVAVLGARDASAASAEAKARAAELFEQGVRQFSGAQYDAAARSFLEADALVPNARALVNGITAARRAGMHLMAARAAQSALARTDVDTGSAALAREALAEAGHNLSLVELSCTPAPCSITVDGWAIAPGSQYLAPGTHDFAAMGGGDASASEHLTSVAGASYRVSLTLQAEPPPPPPSTPVAKETHETPSPIAPAPIAPTPIASAPITPPPPHEEGSRAGTSLSPAVFYAGAAGTAVLVGLTIWSGVDTLSAKSAVEADPSKDWGHVQHLALRTDVFLASAVVLGAATGAAGIWLVDWGSGGHVSAAICPSGAAVRAEGRF
jgi:hypothetical protein